MYIYQSPAPLLPPYIPFCSWLYPRSQHGWLNPWSTAGTCLQDRIQDIPLANPLGKSPWNHDIPSDKILMYWNHGFSHGKTHDRPMIFSDFPRRTSGATTRASWSWGSSIGAVWAAVLWASWWWRVMARWLGGLKQTYHPYIIHI